MAKTKQQRGLPNSFGLDLPESATQAPVRLGDYLDEDPPPSVVQLPQRHAVVQAKPPENNDEQAVLNHDEPEDEAEEVDLPAPRPIAPVREQAHAVRRLPRVTVKRKQINMKAETQRRAEELLDYIQTYSIQSDAKASEMFDALVSLAYEAKEYLDLSNIPQRGKWGSPTAKAFPINLRNCLEQAIVSKHQIKSF